MDGYRTVVVGTDGSESSLRAVDSAGEVAARANAKLIVASAHVTDVEKGGWSRAPSHDRVSDPRGADALGGEGYKLHGSAPVYAILQEAHDRAKAADARDIEERAIEGAPVHALVSWSRRSTRICSSSATWDWTRLPDGSWVRCPPRSPAKPGSTSLSSTRPTRGGWLTVPTHQ
jgi:nucleotide-binding universal stress UspA family protein